MLDIKNGRYQTTGKKCSVFARLFPTAFFYSHLIWIVLRAGWLAKRGRYDDAEWEASSQNVLRKLEATGVYIEVDGLEHVENNKEAMVFVGNHMSMMETVVLPCLIRRTKPVTFVIKESLLHFPVFKYVMRSRNPIAVTRNNPRKDLKMVLTEGCSRLAEGISIIVFPQTTRQIAFNPAQMSTIGVKLAQKSEVPIIPIALKTDAWKNGSWLKDFGRITPQKKAQFCFGAPILSSEDNKHEKINNFIAEKLKEWS